MSGACNPPPCPLEPQVNIPIPPTIPPVKPPGPSKPPQNSKLEVVEISLKASFALCEPAKFEVSKYGKTTPTPDDKKKIKWFVRDQQGTDYVKTGAAYIKADGESLNIDDVPFDWIDKKIEIGAQFDTPPQAAMFSGTPAKCSLHDWISLIQKAEAEFPHLSGVQMTNAMRSIAGYDDAKFIAMYGSSPAGTSLAGGKSFTAADISTLRGMTRHRVSSGVETGIVKDPLGYEVAAGHVLTGLSGGVYRNRSVDITPAYSLTAGERMDNLYAVTISGDLGQVAVFVNEKKQTKPYLGIHGDATHAELVGDIDGFLLGNVEPLGGSGKRLSEILITYYCTKGSSPSYRTRMKDFNAVGTGSLNDQIKRFANTYKYGSEGVVDGLFSFVDGECDESHAEFVKWLAAETATEAARKP
jgi:hypothetical protein